MDDIPFVDATSEPIEVSAEQPKLPSPSDPAMAVTVALANELQNIYANDQTKLRSANNQLRSAIRPKQ